MKHLPAQVRKHTTLITLTIILTTYLFFGLQHIGSFITADEHYWVEERIPQYWEAWSEGKLKKTLINDKPGISLALVSGPALLFHDDTTLDCQEKDGWFSGCDPEEASRLYASFRLPILIVNALFLVLIFFSLRALAGYFVAAAAAALIALSPHLLGMSQIVNPDSLLWSSGSAALFAFLAFLKSGKQPFAVMTALALALALLSKYAALILVFFFPVVLLILFFTDKAFSPIPLKRQITWMLMISAAAFALFLLFAPGILSSKERLFGFLSAGTGQPFAWIGYAILIAGLFLAAAARIAERPAAILRATANTMFGFGAVVFIGAIGAVVFGRHFFPAWPVFDTVPFDIKDLTNARYTLTRFLSPLETAALELSPVIYATPIATLLFGLFTIGKSAVTPFKNRSPLPLILLSFIIVELVALALSNVAAIPRYVILAFPVLSLLAAFGMAEAWKLLPKKIRTAKHAGIACSVVLMISLGSIFGSKPFYANFSNILLPEKSLIIDSWGYGGYEAAQYLNALPDAKRLTIWSDYYGVCEFFVGRCLTAYTFDPETAPDYYVLTRRGKIRYISKYDRWEEKSGLRAYRYYDRTDPEFSISINGKDANFVKVFKVDNELRASIITDIDHCVSREAAPETALDRFVSFTDSRYSDFTISLGDNLSHRLRDCSKHYREDLPSVIAKIGQTASPNHWVLGDHDIASSKESYDFWLTMTGRNETFYSFDEKNVHIIVLNTITGGEPLVKRCEDSPACAKALSEKETIDALFRNPLSFATHLKESGKTGQGITEERNAAMRRYQKELAVIKKVRNASNRDRGMILDRQMDWLAKDIEETPKKRVLVFSDHPLFPFTSTRKRYDIENGELVRKILEESGKEVVAISGEAHLWHEETRNGIRYFIVDQLKEAAGSWAFFSWDKNKEPSFERIITEQ